MITPVANESALIGLCFGEFPTKDYCNLSQKLPDINPLTAGAAHIRVFIFYQHIKYHLLNMLKIKCDINQKELSPILSNLNNFHSLEVVDRVSETQLQVGENSD